MHFMKHFLPSDKGLHIQRPILQMYASPLCARRPTVHSFFTFLTIITNNTATAHSRSDCPFLPPSSDLPLFCQDAFFERAAPEELTCLVAEVVNLVVELNRDNAVKHMKPSVEFDPSARLCLHQFCLNRRLP